MRVMVHIRAVSVCFKSTTFLSNNLFRRAVKTWEFGKNSAKRKEWLFPMGVLCPLLKALHRNESR
jgi:hypothetical protein